MFDALLAVNHERQRPRRCPSPSAHQQVGFPQRWCVRRASRAKHWEEFRDHGARRTCAGASGQRNRPWRPFLAGSNLAEQPGVYGTLRMPGADNVPRGSRSAGSTHLEIFGFSAAWTSSPLPAGSSTIYGSTNHERRTGISKGFGSPCSGPCLETAQQQELESVLSQRGKYEDQAELGMRSSHGWEHATGCQWEQSSVSRRFSPTHSSRTDFLRRTTGQFRKGSTRTFGIAVRPVHSKFNSSRRLRHQLNRSTPESRLLCGWVQHRHLTVVLP
jgi:hypothetical protein